MGFVTGYADLTDYQIGNFRVDILAGRDRTRQPLWKASCSRCHLQQTFTHKQLASALESGKSAEVLFCANGRCPNSRTKDTAESVSLADIRRLEKANERGAEEQAVSDRAKVERELAAAKAKEAALAPLKDEWNEYCNHQINAGVPLMEIAPLSRWVELSESLRQRIMSAISRDPTCRVTGLRR